MDGSARSSLATELQGRGPLGGSRPGIQPMTATRSETEPQEPQPGSGIELEELDRQSEAKEPPPLPGGEVQDPGDRLQFRGQTGRLLLQELVRAGLALAFVALLALVIVLAFQHVNSHSWANVREALEILVPTLSALIGSATGFYFGTRR